MTDVVISEDPVSVAITEDDEVTVVVAEQTTVLVSEVGLQGPEGPAHEVFPFTMQNDLEAVPGTTRVPIDGVAGIESVQAMVGTAPTGSSVIIDVNINGTTIFTEQANRPTIAAGDFTSGAVTVMNVTTLSPGDYLTVDVDQIGSGAPGRDLTVLVRLVKSPLVVLNAHINPAAIQGGTSL